MHTHFRAPWSPSLHLITWGVSALLVGVSFVTPSPVNIVPIGLVVGAAFFSIRGYTLIDKELHVHRLGWVSRVDLSGVETVESRPQAMAGSIRTFGNGGFFGFSGRFRSAVLGRYRAFATDPLRTVVLKLGADTVVVTPDDPEAFVDAVTADLGLEDDL